MIVNLFLDNWYIVFLNVNLEWCRGRFIFCINCCHNNSVRSYICARCSAWKRHILFIIYKPIRNLSHIINHFVFIRVYKRILRYWRLEPCLCSYSIIIYGSIEVRLRNKTYIEYCTRRETSFIWCCDFHILNFLSCNRNQARHSPGSFIKKHPLIKSTPITFSQCIC